MALESTVPEPVSDLKAWPKEAGIFLEWSLPGRNTDGSRLEDLLGFKVMRTDHPLASTPCAECSSAFKEVAEVDMDFPRGALVAGGKVLWRDVNPKSQVEYTYFVVAYNLQKFPGPGSNRVKVFWDDPPSAPASLRIQSEDKALGISWEYVPRLIDGRTMADPRGFNIYRRSEGERFGFFPLNPEPVSDSRYWDGLLENGKRYYYEVRAVRNFRGSLIEGASSTVAEGVPEKSLPPSAPTRLVAVAQKEGNRRVIALRWDRNPEADIAGYDLYRREKGQDHFLKINSELIPGNFFLDESADSSKTYLYRLKAVDTSPAGRESDFSLEVEVSP